MKILDQPAVQKMFRRAMGSPWAMDEDRQFWNTIHGHLGLFLMIEDVHWLRLHLKKAVNDDGSSVALPYRALCLSFCVLVSMLFEAPVRFFARRLPHFSGRFAAEMAWGIYLYVEWVAEEKGLKIEQLLSQEMRDDGRPSSRPRRIRKTASGSS